MYFWNIDKLDAQLIEGELSEAEKIKYLIANELLYALAMIQYFDPNGFDTWSGIVNVFVVLAGLIFIYYCNGGAAGKHLLQRYLSICWVMFLRFLVMAALPSMIVYFVAQEIYFGGIPEETTLTDLGFYSMLGVIYVLLVSKHINKVARATHA